MGISASRRAAVHRAIGQLCASGLPGLDLLQRVAAQVRTVVPYTAGGWLSTDPATLLFTGAFVEDVQREDCPRIKENELCAEDFAKFGDIARSGRRAASLLAETGGELGRSPRYRGIYRRLGVRDEIRTVFRAGGVVLGVGCCVRAGSTPPFSADEVAFVGAIADLVGEGLRRTLLLAQIEAGGSEAPGMIVLGPDDSVLSMTVEAQGLLKEMTADLGVALELPSVVHHVARAGPGGLACPSTRRRASACGPAAGSWSTHRH